MIDPLFNPETIEDPYNYFTELRENEPVHQIPGSNVFLVTRLDLIQKVVTDTATYSNNNTEFLNVDAHGSVALLDVFGNEGGHESMEPALAMADPPDHGRQRKVMTPLFNATSMSKREGEFRSLVNEVLDQLIPTGRIEWMADVAEPLPMVMVTRLLGVEPAHAEELKAHGYASVEAIGGFVSPDRRSTLLSAMGGVSPIYEAYAAACASDTPDTSTIIGTCARAVRDGTLTEGEVTVILGTIVAAGGESTSSLLGTGVRLLAQQPVLQQRLREDPSLIPAFVEEALRIDSPFRGHYRRTISDTVLEGTPIPAGSRMVLVWPAANRDPDAFDDPARIDIDRANPRRHVAFGWGIHLCLGAPLARLEARVSFEQLLARTTFFRICDGAADLVHHRSLMVRRLIELPLVVETSGRSSNARPTVRGASR